MAVLKPLTFCVVTLPSPRQVCFGRSVQEVAAFGVDPWIRACVVKLRDVAILCGFGALAVGTALSKAGLVIALPVAASSDLNLALVISTRFEARRVGTAV